jgi:hypothetical protein
MSLESWQEEAVNAMATPSVSARMDLIYFILMILSVVDKNARNGKKGP